MKPLWDETAAQCCDSALALRAYTSRLIGSDPALVLHGGGNTSLKLDGTLYVKGTGSNLADVREEDFTAMDLVALHALLADGSLADTELMRRIDTCKRVPAAPKPSIETLLHAALPYSFVEHAHADAVLAVANVARGVEACAAAFGDCAPVAPYRHSGAALARACKAVFERDATTNTIGLILAFHGVVAFGTTARNSYDNLQRLVGMAERYLQGHAAAGTAESTHAPQNPDLAAAERLRSAASAVAGYPLAMTVTCTPETLAFAQRPDLAVVSQQGPPTPQHAIFTKRVPLIDGDVAAYATRYRDYLERTLGVAARGRIDAAPRIALDPRFGLCGFGVNAHYAAIAAEIYLHDIDIITRASTHGDYRSAGEHDIARAELEYGGFELRLRELMTH
ncbi:MAG: class II aldolase/adducin family protein [Burkholderiales bacterium]|nr:class II aldolase/adducin family protein [Burkholderiales bacterium]